MGGTNLVQYVIYASILTSFILINQVYAKSEDDDIVQVETVSPEDDYVSPSKPPRSYIAETFDSPDSLNKKWIKSKAKKPDVEEDIAQYIGEWSIEPLLKHPLRGDSGLVQKSKAKHHAISSYLEKTYVFKSSPFVVQYEVMFQEKHDCGGAYIKLLTEGPALKDLTKFNDKTPYTIMFGPDKCGTDDKVHFILRHRNPLNGTMSEKHHKLIKTNPNLFTSDTPHLYTLALYPDNKYAVYIDNELNIEGHLLDEGTFDPPINPPKEIVDVTDKKPQSWDEREKIPDPEATKPEDWDENEPYEITDPDAVKPDGWLEDEPKLIADPTALKPADWDEEMDGDWEAPHIDNPLCADAPGCGPWSAPKIKNPKFKGKWTPPLIDNPNYNGKWSPRMIPNPDYYNDAEPFKLESIGAVGIEIWTMSDHVYFDNILITESLDEAKQFADNTYKKKQQKLSADKESFLNVAIKFTQENPWVWIVYVIATGLVVVLVYVFCCQTTKETREYPRDYKKTDESTPDDVVEPLEQEGDEEDENQRDEEQSDEQGDEEEDAEEGEEEEDEAEEVEEEEIETEPVKQKSSKSKNNKSESKESPAPSSPRKRRSRRE